MDIVFGIDQELLSICRLERLRAGNFCWHMALGPTTEYPCSYNRCCFCPLVRFVPGFEKLEGRLQERHERATAVGFLFIGARRVLAPRRTPQPSSSSHGFKPATHLSRNAAHSRHRRHAVNNAPSTFVLV